MKPTSVTMVRVYVLEASDLLKKIMYYLEKDAKIRGVTVLRAIEGFGSSGESTSGLIDISTNLPLIIEFFDEPEKITPAIEHLATMVKSEHIVYWSATVV